MKLKGFTALAALALAAFAALVLLSESESVSAQGTIPMFFKGTVTVAGSPAPDGYSVFARIEGTGGEDYQSPPVATSGGEYSYLSVGPPQPVRFGARSPFDNQRITFYLEGVPANETNIYRASGNPADSITLNLTFAGLPTPVPTSTPIPTATPVPPTATPVPVHTPTPTVANPMTFSTGLIVAISGDVPADATLTARVGDYRSEPATIAPDGKYYGLIVDAKDPGLIGQEIKFFLDGIEARTTREFESGAVVSSFDIIFALPEIPTAVPTPEPPTPTPVPPPPTPEPPTATPEPPTPTPEPTPIPEPPTATPEPPAPTPVPPTPAPEPTATAEPEPTATPEPEPTNTPIARGETAPPPPPEQSGGCGSTTADLPFGTAAANLALLLAPLGLIGIRKLTIRYRRRR